MTHPGHPSVVMSRCRHVLRLRGWQHHQLDIYPAELPNPAGGVFVAGRPSRYASATTHTTPGPRSFKGSLAHNFPCNFRLARAQAEKECKRGDQRDVEPRVRGDRESRHDRHRQRGHEPRDEEIERDAAGDREHQDRARFARYRRTEVSEEDQDPGEEVDDALEEVDAEVFLSH